MNIFKLLLLICLIYYIKTRKCKQKLKKYQRRGRKLLSTQYSESLFSTYVKDFDKNYTTAQYEHRLGIFQTNIELINEKNEANTSATFGLTSYTDMSRNEMKNEKKYCLKIRPGVERKMAYPEILRRSKVPSEWDWRKQGAVTRAKNQGTCGACWAFSAAGAVEGRHFMKHNKLVELSVQQFLDCCTNENNCDGGYPEEAIRVVTDFGGVVRAKDYPYKEDSSKCKQWNKTKVAEIDGADVVYVPSEEHLKHLIYRHGPVAAGMQTGLGFFNYMGGVVGGNELDCVPGKTLSHAVLIVGYGGAPGKEYWIIKNSFGRQWGEKGFFRLRRNVFPESTCSITEYLVDVHVL